MTDKDFRAISFHRASLNCSILLFLRIFFGKQFPSFRMCFNGGIFFQDMLENSQKSYAMKSCSMDALSHSGENEVATFFHVHLVSDSTGETLSTLLKAVASRFETAHPLDHVQSLIRSPKQLNKVLAQIESSPGIVMYTIVDPDLRRQLEIRCAELHMPAISVLDPMLDIFAAYLGLEKTEKTGAQHAMDEAYFRRIAALDYTLAHDDGQMLWDLEAADVVLVGVSRTSKTPTCMYLANRGIKAANVPLVPGQDPPKELEELKNPLMIGLVASSDRLVQIRTSRLDNLDANTVTQYTDESAIREELMRARRFFTKKGWPVINVTRRSVEETAANIMTRLSDRKSG